MHHKNSSIQCQATTKSGNPCKNKTKTGTFCRVHDSFTPRPFAKHARYTGPSIIEIMPQEILKLISDHADLSTFGRLLLTHRCFIPAYESEMQAAKKRFTIVQVEKKPNIDGEEFRVRVTHTVGCFLSWDLLMSLFVVRRRIVGFLVCVVVRWCSEQLSTRKLFILRV